MVCAAPVASRASRQRSRNFCCWRCTTAGTRGSAWSASSRSLATRSISTAVSFWPSRLRACLRPSMARRAASRATSSSRSGVTPPLHQCSTSLTDRGAALGSQLCTVSCNCDRRLNWLVWGWGQACSLSLRVDSRNSILPRLKAAETSSRSAGSSERSSSGKRNERSRKRPLTERSSTFTAALAAAPATAAGEGEDAAPETGSVGLPCSALAAVLLAMA